MVKYRDLMGLGLCLGLGAFLSIMAGQDTSWDLRNYHVYNALSVLDGRMDLDFFPADKHSGLNPLLDFMYVCLGRGPFLNYPRLLAALMGFWYGALVFVILKIGRTLCVPLFSRSEQRLLFPLICVTALTGGMTLSQIGTTSNDIATATLIISGLYFVLQALAQNLNTLRLFFIGGLFFGLAAGAKLTALVYSPALLIALLLSVPAPFSIRACLAFCFTWIIGFLLSFAWWASTMVQRYHNPTFPMLNGFFKSPLAPSFNLMDARFLPRNIWQWLAYPLFWAWDKSNHLVYEFDFRDPRMAFAYSTFVVFAGLKLFDYFRYTHNLKTKLTNFSFTHTEKFCLLFTVFSYTAWLCTTSILRYAIPCEILSVLCVVILVMRIKMSPRSKHIILSAYCLLSLMLTSYADWGHSPFGSKVFESDLSESKPNTLFLGLYEPFAYLAALVPPQAHDQFVGLGFISYTDGWPLGEKGKQLIQDHQGPFVVLLREDKKPYLSLLTSVGLSQDVQNCRRVLSNLEPSGHEPLLACEVSRL